VLSQPTLCAFGAIFRFREFVLQLTLCCRHCS
jgi:hypothetical protein